MARLKDASQMLGFTWRCSFALGNKKLVFFVKSRWVVGIGPRIRCEVLSRIFPLEGATETTSIFFTKTTTLDTIHYHTSFFPSNNFHQFETNLHLIHDEIFQSVPVHRGRLHGVIIGGRVIRPLPPERSIATDDVDGSSVGRRRRRRL